MKLKFQLLLLAGSALFFGCKRSSDKPMWDVNILTPLVQSSLTISNLIKDTSSIHLNADKSITIVNRQSLSNVTIDSLVSLSTDPYSDTETLSSLVLPTRIDTTLISIGTIADKLIATGDQDNINLGNGLKFAAQYGIPIDLSNIPALMFDNLSVDINNFFQTADIATGSLTVEIVNNLPADVQSLSFSFKNASGGPDISSHTFSNIAALGGSDSYIEPLANKHVEGALLGSINPLQLSGQPNTVVTLDQSLMVIMTITGVTVTSATAIFPDQDVMQKQEETSLTSLGDVLLKTAVIDSGSIKMDVTSTIKQDVSFTYTIPKAMKNGVAFQQTAFVPAATISGPSHKVISFPLNGYSMDFTGIASDTFNTFYYTLTGRIISSGTPVDLSLTDYMTITVSAEDMQPTSVEGYLGQNTFNIGPAALDLTIFKGVESGTLNFENVDMNMVVENGFGIDAAIQINDISTGNSRTNQFHSLSGTPSSFNISRAPSQGLTTTTSHDFGTDATNLINILPNKVSYSATVKTNPLGNQGTYNDFASKTSLMKAFLDIEMPLSILASQLVLSDTAVFNTAALKKKSVQSGTFTVFVGNGFPLNAALQMYFLNSAGTKIDSLISLPGAILAAPVDGSYRVTEKKNSQISFEVGKQTMDNLYNSTQVIFKIEFTTEPTSQFMKIYSDYSIDFKMVGDMDYAIHKK
ncbi:MAG TPA: hypothetical protein VNB90_08225 [Cytophagaceae bacterium]|nr:hypothetical protein [Cytophagaceae bacterium]